MNNLTIVYYTANVLNEQFARAVREQLKRAACRQFDRQKAIPIVSVSQKPLDFGENICLGDIGRSLFSQCRQEIAGCERADTKYVALCEDDIFYPASHFELRPNPGFAGIFDQHCHRLLLRQQVIRLFCGGRSMFLLIGDRERILEDLKGKLRLFKTAEDFSGHWEPGKGEQDLGLPDFPIGPGAGRDPIINVCNHGLNMSLKPKRTGDFWTDRLPDGRTVDELIEQWHLPELGGDT